MQNSGGEKLSKNQYGFRKGKSTIEAIMRFREIVTEKQKKGLEVLAISLDIKNAFNSIEWGEIQRAIKRKGFPGYIQNIIGGYLSDRRIVWIGNDGGKRSKTVERGVPQGSVLGPLLWNITFDSVLRMPTPADCEIICYADDTLIIVGGKDIEEAIDKANIIGNIIARKVKWMGLQVAANKTEAIRFRREGKRRKRDNKMVTIEDSRIVLGHSLKYLGITVRDDWSIKDHLEKTAIKAGIIANNLSRLMLNKKGPTEKKRRLYQNVINSVHSGLLKRTVQSH